VFPTRLKSTAGVECCHTTSGRFEPMLQIAARNTQVQYQIGAMTGVESLESPILPSTRIDRAV